MPFPIDSPKHLCCTVAFHVHMWHMTDVVVGDIKLYHRCALFSSTLNAHIYRQCVTVRCEKGRELPHSSTDVSYLTVVIIQIRFSSLSAEVDRVKQQGSRRFTVRTMVYPVIIRGTPVIIRHNKCPLTTQTLSAYRGLPCYNSGYTCYNKAQ